MAYIWEYSSKEIAEMNGNDLHLSSGEVTLLEIIKHLAAAVVRLENEVAALKGEIDV